MEATTALVAGATGFIGSRIVRLLLEKVGSEVVASKSSGSSRNMGDLLDKVEIRRPT
jgi:nucleoside-diphosphate-sugar epimerase